MENIEDFLRELRESVTTEWIASEVDETLSQGISMNVKDAAADSNFFDLLPSKNLLVQEKYKRQKYETSRAFTNEEKLEVILKALEVMYLDLPAIRRSAIKNLYEFDNKIEAIVFSSGDEEITEKEISHEINIHRVDDELDRYRNLHSEFIKEIN